MKQLFTLGASDKLKESVPPVTVSGEKTRSGIVAIATIMPTPVPSVMVLLKNGRHQIPQGFQVDTAVTSSAYSAVLETVLAMCSLQILHNLNRGSEGKQSLQT